MGQSEHSVDPICENCPGMHASHSVDASEFMNRPAEHAAHSDKPDALAYFPTEQARQTSPDVAPTIELVLPGMHCKH
jgi:hypothetical protein